MALSLPWTASKKPWRESKRSANASGGGSRRPAPPAFPEPGAVSPTSPARRRRPSGGGYSDLEFAPLVEACRIDSGTALATTVHGLQVLDEELPETEHDFRVDLVVTATETLAPPSFRQPPGVIREKVDAIPVLRQLNAAAANYEQTMNNDRSIRHGQASSHTSTRSLSKGLQVFHD